VLVGQRDLHGVVCRHVARQLARSTDQSAPRLALEVQTFELAGCGRESLS
jgi:hypothetical protein